MGFFNRDEFKKIIQNEKVGEIINEKIKEIIKEQIEKSKKDLFEEEVEKEAKEILRRFIQILYDKYNKRLQDLKLDQISVVQRNEAIYRIPESPEKVIYFRNGIEKSFVVFSDLLEELKEKFLAN